MAYKRSFFEGDFELTDDNVYTKIHKYQKEDKTVILATVNHIGSKEYFKRIEKILDGCDCVLYELIDGYGEPDNERFTRMRDEKEDSLDKIINRYPRLENRFNNIKRFNKMYSNVFLLNPQKTFTLVLQHYNQTIIAKDIFQEQTKCIDVRKPNWEVCDIIPYEARVEIFLKFFENLKLVDEKKLINTTLTMLEGIILADKNQLDSKHFIEVIKNGYGDIFDMPEITKPLATREKNIMKRKLKEKLKDKKIKTIGIIYGAGHGPNIRRIIESLQFKKVKTTSLKSLD